MAFGCRICIMTKGLKGSDLKSLPQTQDELAEHLEREHGIVVKRDNETDEQATKRFEEKYRNPNRN